jgi:molybdate transport system regulatory protein
VTAQTATPAGPPGVRLHLRLDFPTGARIGPGKIDLLQAIARTGSITAAGRTMGMSYRRAWLLVDALNRMFDQPLVMTTTGGARGGGATLTPLAGEVINAYRRIATEAEAEAARQLAALAVHLKPKDGG